MDRRKFVFGIAAVVAATAIPIINYRCSHFVPGGSLARPSVLTNFCDKNAIRDIGLCYRDQVPEENEKRKLEDLLLTHYGSATVDSTSNDKVIREFLENKINQEFRNGKIVIENGWVLSETEARQCALYSFLE